MRIAISFCALTCLLTFSCGDDTNPLPAGNTSTMGGGASSATMGSTASASGGGGLTSAGDGSATAATTQGQPTAGGTNTDTTATGATATNGASTAGTATDGTATGGNNPDGTGPEPGPGGGTDGTGDGNGDGTGDGPGSVPSGSLGPLKPFECGQITVDEPWLRARVAHLTGWVETQIAGQSTRLGERYTEEGRKQARAWLKEQYKALGYDVSEQPFSKGANVVAVKRGASSSFYVISAHLDTVEGTVGADDDGSGLAANLAIAAALAPCDLAHTVQFVAFDQQERTKAGSYHYARKLANTGKADKMLGAIQIEMSGFDSDNDGAFNIVNCDLGMNEPLTQAVTDAVAQSSASLTPVTACSRGSDHQAFWSIDRPAVAVSQYFFGDKPDRNPCFHQPCDKYDKINFSYLTKLTRLYTQTALNLTYQPGE